VPIVGGSRSERLAAAQRQGESADVPPSSRLAIDAFAWPFRLPGEVPLPGAQPRLVWIDDIEDAFPDNQVGGTRLVLTQSAYLLQTLLDRLGPNDRLVATASREALEKRAPEAFEGRGPWQMFTRIDLAGADAGAGHIDRDVDHLIARESPTLAQRLAMAFVETSAERRLAFCRSAWQEHLQSAVAALAFASACRETQDPASARETLDAVVRLAPDWAAGPFERAKLWLASEEMGRARADFARAAELMPTFSAAFSNLGATLGELDQPEAALEAFGHALAHDPGNVTVLNNIGVVNRELGRLAESEAALTDVVSRAPAFVFGHYNLGHTRFLRGDYPGALAAYEDGQRRDSSRNRRQGCRLALVRLANGDLEGATRDFWSHADAAAGDEREDLLLEAYEIAQALVSAQPGLPGGQQFLHRIETALTV
jgi:tetratricopeptide (TPR) repeat protein